MAGRLTMTIAALRRRLVIESAVETPDGAGGVHRSFVVAASVWGRVTPLRASDSVVAAAPGQTLTHRVLMRFRSNMDTTMRLRDGSRRLAIRAVYDPDGRRKLLVCLCEEVRA